MTANIFSNTYATISENARDDLRFIKSEVIKAKEIGAIACLLLNIYICAKLFILPMQNPGEISSTFVRFITFDALLILYWWMYRDQTDSMISMLRIEVMITTAFLFMFAGIYS